MVKLNVKKELSFNCKKPNIYSMLFKYAIFPFVLVIIVDYFNVPSIIGFEMSNINFDLIGALINALIVLCLYIITYAVIDRRQMQKDDNAKLTANLLILSTYKKCQDLLKIIDNQEWLENYIVPKIDFNKIDSKNEVSMNLQNDPFTEHSHILDLAGNGSITISDLKMYLNVMESYRSYVSMRITLYDIYNAKTVEQMQLYEHIIEKRNLLNDTLESEVEKMKSKI